MKVCPNCKKELRALVHAIHKFDGKVKGKITNSIKDEDIRAVFCSDETCGFVCMKGIHDLDNFLVR